MLKNFFGNSLESNSVGDSFEEYLLPLGRFFILDVKICDNFHAALLENTSEHLSLNILEHCKSVLTVFVQS